MALRKHLNAPLHSHYLGGWPAHSLARLPFAAPSMRSLWQHAAWKLIEIDYKSYPRPHPYKNNTKSLSSLEASWEIALETNNAPRVAFIFVWLLFICALPRPGRNVKCSHSHACVFLCMCVCVCLCKQQTNVFYGYDDGSMMSLRWCGGIWSVAAGQKDIDCQDFATLSFRLRPTRARRPLWCATWHCYKLPASP